MNHDEMIEADGKDDTVQPIPRWVRNTVLPFLPACLLFGPFFMVMPGVQWINIAGALMLGFALSVLFVVVGRCLFPPE